MYLAIFHSTSFVHFLLIIDIYIYKIYIYIYIYISLGTLVPNSRD